jgi:uncharacterized membrane protein
MQHGTYSVDVLAVGFFIIEWLIYAVTLEHDFNRGRRAFLLCLGYLG